MPARLRFADSSDAATILRLVRELATYEREPDAVQATEDDLRVQLEDPQRPFECVIAEVDEADPFAVGFALFFHNYSTWRGRRGLYLEDLYVDPQWRGRGIGKLLLQALAGIAVARGCPRMEWSVLDWNRPAIDFYEALGARPMSKWTTYRLADDALAGFATDAPTISRT